MVYIGIACLVMFLDLQLKHWIELGKGFEKKAKTLQQKVFRNKIIIDCCYNFGAAFNLGDKKPKTIKRISEALLGCIIVLFALALQNKKSGMYRFGMALLLGGSASNVYDRKEKGYVVDYICLNVGWKRLKQVVFNLADMSILLGAVIILIEKIRE